jgi:hypothetical protein
VVVDRKVDAMHHEKLATILLKKILVRHPLFDLLRRRRETMRALRQDLSFLIQTVDPIDPLGVHQIGRVPPP